MAPVPAIIPAPDRVDLASGRVVLTERTRVVVSPELRDAAIFLQDLLRPATGLPLLLGEPEEPGADRSAEPETSGPKTSGPETSGPETSGPETSAAGDASVASIVLQLDRTLADEEYRLEVGAEDVRIVGGAVAGVRWGCQTLLQLLPPEVYRRSRQRVEWAVPRCVVEDHPRFPWRGVMLDVARHFMPKHDVLRFIDLLAMHKLNTLHLHLTDDQGWRLQIAVFPKLTEIGSWRSRSQWGAGTDAGMLQRPHGGFYTREDAREIVDYAQSRGVTVVPEIESPGHVQAALAAYPEWGVGDGPAEPWPHWGVNTRLLNLEQQTVSAFCAILDEVMEIFDSPFIGVGGDEARKDEWEEDPRTQQLMRERGIRDEEGAQSWFIAQLDAHVSARGRRIFGWDEILEGGLADGATVLSWRGTYGAVAAARAGHDVVLCPDDQVYLDYRESDLETEPIPVGFPLGVDDVYAFDPVPPELTEAEAAHVLGGQANIWTEHMDSPRTVDYKAFPRVCALAEAVWAARKDLDGFRDRAEAHRERLDAIGVEYRPEEGPRPWQQRPGVPGKPLTREERLAIQRELIRNLTDEGTDVEPDPDGASADGPRRP